MMDIKSKVESGSSLSQAFRQYPDQFDSLYCNLVNAGETAGMLDAILERLATYKEKILAIKAKIKSALFYPMSVIVVAIVVVWVIMIFVIPAFKEVFSSFGADLPAPTMMVIELSDFMAANIATLGLAMPMMRAKSMAFWMMSTFSGKVGRMLSAASVIRSGLG